MRENDEVGKRRTHRQSWTDDINLSFAERSTDDSLVFPLGTLSHLSCIATILRNEIKFATRERLTDFGSRQRQSFISGFPDSWDGEPARLTLGYVHYPM